MQSYYDIHGHSHRFAAWAAATGASASPRCRFTVEAGKAILERAGFDARLRHPKQLPSPGRMDEVHLAWRKAVIREAHKVGLEFTHGIAAKLIKLYLKAKLTCGGYADHPRVAALHPPIDSLLLKAFNRTKQPTDRLPVHWSTFDSQTYLQAIHALREACKGLPSGPPNRSGRGIGRANQGLYYS
jgi:hypothetical protein